MAKYIIRFLPEYSSTCLWPESKNSYEDFDIPISYESVNLSSELIKQLEAFDDSIMDILDWSNPGGPSPLSKDERMQIYNEGVRLLELVRKELGNDFEVINELDWIYPKD